MSLLDGSLVINVTFSYITDLLKFNALNDDFDFGRLTCGIKFYVDNFYSIDYLSTE